MGVNSATPHSLPTEAPQQIAAASVWRRLMGMVYEALLLFGPLLLIGFIYSVLVDLSDKASPEFADFKRFGLQVTIGLSLLAYFGWGWSLGRCTLPMQTLGMRVKSINGNDISVAKAAIRALIALPSVMSGIGFLWAVVDRDSQALHDRLCGTRLVHIPVNRII